MAYYCYMNSDDDFEKLDNYMCKILCGDNVMLTENIVFPKASIPMHSHTHEQIIYIIKGECMLYLDNKKFQLTAGSSVHIPKNCKHKLVNLLGSNLHTIDVFTPIRKDLL